MHPPIRHPHIRLRSNMYRKCKVGSRYGIRGVLCIDPLRKGYIVQHITMHYTVGRSKSTFKYTEAWPIPAGCCRPYQACDADYFLVPSSALSSPGCISISSVAWYERTLPRGLRKQTQTEYTGLWGVLPGAHGHLKTSNFNARGTPKLIRQSKGIWLGRGGDIKWHCKSRSKTREWKRCALTG